MEEHEDEKKDEEVHPNLTKVTSMLTGNQHKYTYQVFFFERFYKRTLTSQRLVVLAPSLALPAAADALSPN